ncbi:MAG: DUF4238 domain-containing protein [Methylococcales bacterium]
MSNISKNHHFVPQFYLKGFCDEKGNIFTYKKEYGKIKYWKTSQILYEINLHTLEYRDEKTVLIENFYSDIEGEFSKYLNMLKENPDMLIAIQDQPEFLKIMKLMVAIQFWRTPCMKELSKEYAENLIEIYNNAQDENKNLLPDTKFLKFLEKRFKKFKDENARKTIQFIFLPILTFDFSDNRKGNIKFIKSETDKKFITSDRPVVFCDLNMPNRLKHFEFKNFVFPISKDLMMLTTENVKTIEELNMLIIERADKVVVASSNE